MSEFIIIDTIDLGPRSRLTTMLHPPGERRAGCTIRLESRSGDEWSRRFDTWMPISKLPHLIEALIEAEKQGIDFGWLKEPVIDGADASEGVAQ
jgi:hypothetical protein